MENPLGVLKKLSTIKYSKADNELSLKMNFCAVCGDSRL